MKFFIDRIINDKIVCVTSDGNTFNLPIDIIENPKEGDRFIIKKDEIGNSFIKEKNEILINKVFK